MALFFRGPDILREGYRTAIKIFFFLVGEEAADKGQGNCCKALSKFIAASAFTCSKLHDASYTRLLVTSTSMMLSDMSVSL